jgi:hypothetical protein
MFPFFRKGENKNEEFALSIAVERQKENPPKKEGFSRKIDL